MVTFSHDGKVLASGGGSQVFLKYTELKLWDVTTLREIARIQGHSDAVSSLAFSPDDSMLVSGGYVRKRRRATSAIHDNRQQRMRRTSTAKVSAWVCPWPPLVATTRQAQPVLARVRRGG